MAAADKADLRESLGDDIGEWWQRISNADFHRAMPKAQEYGGGADGSADLRVMGDALAELLHYKCPECGYRPQRLTSVVAQELACWLYTLGKVARLISDYKQGRAGKEDTWFDISIYSRMARRLLQVGRWP